MLNDTLPLFQMCSVDRCCVRVSGHPGTTGLCALHLKRFKRTGTTDAPAPHVPKVCAVDGCERLLTPPYGRGMCSKHYLRWQRYGDPLHPSQRRVKADVAASCSVDNCHAVAKAAGFCVKHYARNHRSGDPNNKWSTAVERTCAVCTETYLGSARQSKTCSPACKAVYDRELSRLATAAYRKVNPKPPVPTTAAVCPYCQQDFRANKRRSLYCSRACAKNDKYKASYQIRLDRLKVAEREVFDKVEIFLRDGWICGICATPIDPQLSWPHRQSASLDHIYPVSLGGGHVRANVQAAHLLCNIKKSNKVA